MIHIQPVEEFDKGEILALFRSDEEARKIWSSGVGQSWYFYWDAGNPREHWVKAFEPGGRIIGSVHWLVRLDGWKSLRDIVVDPAARGQGVGRLLVEHLGLPIVLKTDQDSLANNFYRRLGFKIGETSLTRNGKKYVTAYTKEAS